MTTKSKFPDFLIIGAGKSGTTSLNNYLKQHPQIFIPQLKEPNFFGYELFSEKDFEGLPILTHFKNSVTELEDYLELFKPAKENQLLGETSNTYLYHEKAPERILHYIPEVKLIGIFRQPVERLYSRFLHLAREDRLPTKTFIDCLDKESIWWQRNDLINEGFYYKHLSRYYSMFDKSQIKVFLYEEFQKDPMKLLKDIFRFLEVDDQFLPDVTVSYNKSGYIKNSLYNKIFGQNGLMRQLLVAILPQSGYKKLKQNLFMQKYLNKIREVNLEKPTLDMDTKFRITEIVYKEDIIKFSKLIGRDLNHWISS